MEGCPQRGITELPEQEGLSCRDSDRPCEEWFKNLEELTREEKTWEGGSRQCLPIITSFLGKEKGCQEEEEFICLVWPQLVVPSVEFLVTFQEKRFGPRFLSVKTVNKMCNNSSSPMGSTISMLLSQVSPFLGS